MRLPTMHNPINLKPKPAVAVMGQFSIPLQTAGRGSNQLLPEFYKAMLGYSDHVAVISNPLDGVKWRDGNFGVYRHGYRD